MPLNWPRSPPQAYQRCMKLIIWRFSYIIWWFPSYIVLAWLTYQYADGVDLCAVHLNAILISTNVPDMQFGLIRIHHSSDMADESICFPVRPVNDDTSQRRRTYNSPLLPPPVLPPRSPPSTSSDSAADRKVTLDYDWEYDRRSAAGVYLHNIRLFVWQQNCWIHI